MPFYFQVVITHESVWPWGTFVDTEEIGGEEAVF